VLGFASRFRPQYWVFVCDFVKMQFR
jgi:hypothetical protein